MPAPPDHTPPPAEDRLVSERPARPASPTTASSPRCPRRFPAPAPGTGAPPDARRRRAGPARRPPGADPTRRPATALEAGRGLYSAHPYPITLCKLHQGAKTARDRLKSLTLAPLTTAHRKAHKRCCARKRSRISCTCRRPHCGAGPTPSRTFCPHPRPARRPRPGGAAQRRYSDQDVLTFRTVQRLLTNGKTYEEVTRALQDGVKFDFEQEIESANDQAAGLVFGDRRGNGAPRRPDLPGGPGRQGPDDRRVDRDGGRERRNDQDAFPELSGKDELIAQVQAERDRLLQASNGAAAESSRRRKRWLPRRETGAATAGAAGVGRRVACDNREEVVVGQGVQRDRS